jgi:hypothetical protein
VQGLCDSQGIERARYTSTVSAVPYDTSAFFFDSCDLSAAALRPLYRRRTRIPSPLQVEAGSMRISFSRDMCSRGTLLSLAKSGASSACVFCLYGFFQGIGLEA